MREIYMAFARKIFFFRTLGRGQLPTTPSSPTSMAAPKLYVHNFLSALRGGMAGGPFEYATAQLWTLARCIWL